MGARYVFVRIAVVVALSVATRSLAASPQAKAVELTVTEKGFEPSHVKVTNGEPLKLIVTRKTDNTCAKETVIPDANLKAELPLNQPVTLSFTPRQSGEITYACGMNMITGVLEVVSNGPRQGGSESMGGMMGGDGQGMMGGMMGGSMQEMTAIHGLLSQHESIRRSVKNLPDGVETVTTSDDPEVTKLIREHVWQMKTRLQDGSPIRQMDPLFREIFANHQHIHMNIEDVPGGVRVTETADDQRVVPLVRQHARRAVSEFVAGGMRRAMQPTPLPPGYEPTRTTEDHHSSTPSHRCGCCSSST